MSFTDFENEFEPNLNQGGLSFGNIGNLTAADLQGSSLSGGIIGATIGTGTAGTTTSSPTGTSTPNTSAANPNANATPSTPTSTGPTQGSLADYFARAIIIILGFIFVAVGLNMLRPGTVPLPRVLGK